MAERRFTAWMLLSWLVPVIGGIIAYFVKKSEDEELAEILLVGTFTIPSQFLFGAIAGLIGVPFFFISVPGAILLVIGLRKLLDNYYSGILWAYYFGLIGAIYPYYKTYSDDKKTRATVGWFAFLQVVLVVLLQIIIAGLMAQTAPSIETVNSS